MSAHRKGERIFPKVEVVVVIVAEVFCCLLVYTTFFKVKKRAVDKEAPSLPIKKKCAIETSRGRPSPTYSLRH